MNKRVIFTALVAVCGASSWASGFNAGDVAVFQADPVGGVAANNTTFGILDLSSFTANQAAPTNTFAINGTTGTSALRTSGSATSTGYLSRSNDGSLLTFTGHDSTTATGNANTITARGVGSLDVGGNFALQTTYTGTSGNQTRSATSLDNSNWYIGDQGGLYTNGATASSPTGNFRKVHAFGGTVYGSAASATVNEVGTYSAITGGTYTGLNGLGTDSALVDFYMVSSGSNGSTFDEIYTLDDTSATVGAINKFSLVSGTWVANGSYTTSFGGFGLAARGIVGAAGTSLFATTGTGATTANSLMRLTDTAGWNSAITINTANNVNLYTAAAGEVLKGVDFAPQAVPEPATYAVLGFGVFALLRRRRK